MWVEGIGDEVLLLLSVLVGFILLIIAWLSTYVAEQQVNVILIDRRSFHTLVQRILNHIPGRSQPAAPEDVINPVEMPPVEDLFEIDSDNGELLPVQIVGMSEMEHFLSDNHAEEVTDDSQLQQDVERADTER